MSPTCVQVCCLEFLGDGTGKEGPGGTWWTTQLEETDMKFEGEEGS